MTLQVLRDRQQRLIVVLTDELLKKHLHKDVKIYLKTLSFDDLISLVFILFQDFNNPYFLSIFLFILATICLFTQWSIFIKNEDF